MKKTASGLLAVLGLLACGAISALAGSGSLQGGDAIVSGFPGIADTRPLQARQGPVPAEKAFIDLAGASVRIRALGSPGFVWDGRVWRAPLRRTVKAGETGLVFGIAIDDAPRPNVYFTATSAFGIHIAIPDTDGDGRPEHGRTGQPGAVFMPGQWGPSPDAGPGSIWKLDGQTGRISLFANVTLNGAPNSGPALGNIAYDRAHRQLFVSDRDTGMIHRFDLSGRELGVFDHGTAGRAAAGLAPVPFDPVNRLDITSAGFDSEDPGTWGYAAPKRRVWGLAVHGGRLFYAVARGEASAYPQVWSVGLDARTGAFLADARLELTLPAEGTRDEISDMAFTAEGAMILAQRGRQKGRFDYTALARTGAARVLRYWPEVPDDPRTPSRWIAQPEEYAVGFRGGYRNTNGGIALGYGYTPRGRINRKVCQASLWVTGEALRDNPALAGKLRKGGPLDVAGLQGMPTRPVRDFNTPPWSAYYIDHDGRFGGPRTSGWLGDVEVYTPGCGAINANDKTPPYTAWNFPAPQEGPWVYGEDLTPACTWANGCIGIADEPQKPAFEVAKSCFCQAGGEDGKISCQCKIKVTSNGVPFPGKLVISDALSATGGTITAIGSSDPWVCSPPSGAPDCSITGTYLAASGNSSVIDVTVEFDSVEDMDKAKNCASGQAADGQGGTTRSNVSCTGFAGVKVEKKLKGHCQFGAACSYEFVVTNLSSTTPYNGPVTIVDQLSGATMTITNITPAMCSPEPASAPFACVANVSLAPGASQTFTVTGMQVPTGGYGKDTVEVKNCASTAPAPQSTSGEWWSDYLQQTPDNASCVSHRACTFNCHMTNTSDLTVKKELKSDSCKPGGMCTYTITMTNTGSAPRSGPFSILEQMPAGATFVSASPLPWTCAPNNTTPGNDMVCKYPPGMPVAAGGSLSFDVTIAIPADFSGSEIKNCAGFDVAPLGGSASRIAKQVARLPGMAKRGAKAGDAQAALAQYFLSRGMGDAGSKALARRIYRQALAGDVVSGAQKSCVTVPVDKPGEEPSGGDTGGGATGGNDTTAPEPPRLSVVKFCQPVVGDAVGFSTDCRITVTGTNLQPGKTIQLLEKPVTTGQVVSITSATPLTPPLACTGVPAAANQQAQCAFSSDALINANGTLSFNVHITGLNEGWIEAGHGKNCANVIYDPDGPSPVSPAAFCDVYHLAEPQARAVPPVISAPRCDPRTTVRKGKACLCRFGGARRISPTACACPRGTRLDARHGKCVKIPRCRKPARLNAARTACVCPRGFRPDGRGGCRKLVVCKRPARPNKAGTACYCPRGWRPDGRNGCRKLVVCKKPARPNRARTACICPRGYKPDGRNGCRKIRPAILCIPPARAIPGRRGCACPRGWIKTSPVTCARIRPRGEHPRPDGPKGGHPRQGGGVTIHIPGLN